MATREQVLECVKAILVQQLGVDADEVVEEAYLNKSHLADEPTVPNLEADSLDLTELIMEIEDNFEIKITDEDALTLTTVGQAVDYIIANVDGDKLDEVVERLSKPKEEASATAAAKASTSDATDTEGDD